MAKNKPKSTFINEPLRPFYYIFNDCKIHYLLPASSTRATIKAYKPYAILVYLQALMCERSHNMADVQKLFDALFDYFLPGEEFSPFSFDPTKNNTTISKAFFLDSLIDLCDYFLELNCHSKDAVQEIKNSAETLFPYSMPESAEELLAIKKTLQYLLRQTNKTVEGRSQALDGLANCLFKKTKTGVKP